LQEVLGKVRGNGGEQVQERAFLSSMVSSHQTTGIPSSSKITSISLILFLSLGRFGKIIPGLTSFSVFNCDSI
jgi:hypothetical protein